MKVLRAGLRELPRLEEVLVLMPLHVAKVREVTILLPLRLTICSHIAVGQALWKLSRHLPAFYLEVQVGLKLSFLRLDRFDQWHLHVPRDHRMLMREMQALVCFPGTVHGYVWLEVEFAWRNRKPLDTILLSLYQQFPLFRLHLASYSVW